jgi:uncharacterized protein YcbX
MRNSEHMLLSEINIYPVKSLRGISLKEAAIERRGLQLDRRWMLVDKNNKFLTQREFPKMATLVPEIKSDGLRISNGKKDGITVPFEFDFEKNERVRIWKSICRAEIYNDSINQFFSDALETKCRLVFMPDETKRKVNYLYKIAADDHVSFADGYPFMLLGKNSLANLNEKLDEPLPMNRFRPNFVIADSEAFAEDGWKRIRIGDAIFNVVKPSERCVIPTIDQQTGIKTGVEPTKTLASFRTTRGMKKKVIFGQNLIAEKGGEILRVGDKLEILETKNTPRFVR